MMRGHRTSHRTSHHLDWADRTGSKACMPSTASSTWQTMATYPSDKYQGSRAQAEAAARAAVMAAKVVARVVMETVMAAMAAQEVAAAVGTMAVRTVVE